MNLLKIIALWILNLITLLIPDNIIPASFISGLDVLISTFIGFLNGARWFFDMNMFLLCFGIIIAVNNWALIARVVQFVVKVVRG